MNQLSKEEQDQVLREIKEKIQNSCEVNKYSHLCQRISTEGGFAWAVNRCIGIMVNNKSLLSSALATLESELEGMN